MFAIVSTLDGKGVTTVHTRHEREEALQLGADLCIARTRPRDPVGDQAIRDEALQTLRVHGTYTGSGWDVTVVEIEDSPELLGAPLTLREARKRLVNDELVVTLALGITEFGGEVDDLNDLMDERIAEDGAFTLSDIRYRVVGHIPGQTGGHYLSGAVLLEVRAEITSMGGDDDEEGGGSDDDSGDDDDDDRLEPRGRNDQFVGMPWSQ